MLFYIPHFCLAQDTLSEMTMLGDWDCYRKSMDKAFDKMNRRYRLGRHETYVVYDLVDTSNRMITEKDTLLLVNKHVYHVVSPWVYSKVSMIVVPFEGELFAFLGLNCCEGGHNVEDVLHWMGNNLQNVDDNTLERIRNYRLFHPNLKMDPQGSIPECEYRCKDCQSEKQQRHDHFKKPKRIKMVKF